MCLDCCTLDTYRGSRLQLGNGDRGGVALDDVQHLVAGQRLLGQQLRRRRVQGAPVGLQNMLRRYTRERIAMLTNQLPWRLNTAQGPLFNARYDAHEPMQ